MGDLWMLLGFVMSVAWAAIYWALKDEPGWQKKTAGAVCLPLALGCWMGIGGSHMFGGGHLLGWIVGGVILYVLKMFGLFGGLKSARRSGVLRGTEIISDDEAIAELRDNNCPARIGRVPIPVDVEPTGFLFCGATGSGKSQGMIQLLDSARARGHRAVIADLGGEFVKRYYREGRDAILNPFDERSLPWSPFAEMKSSYDAARIAASIIPEGSGETAEWNGYARTILEALLEKCFESGQTTNSELMGYVFDDSISHVRKFLTGTVASTYFSEGNERQLGSIRGILAKYLKPFTNLKGDAGADSFSIGDWMSEECDSWIFVTFRKDQLDALRPLIAAQIDTAAAALMSQETKLDRRVWFGLDEFPQIGQLANLESLLSQGRKTGACSILGMQTTASASMVYGRDKAQAMLANCGTWAVYKQGDADTAEYMSKFLGDEEIRRTVHSENKNTNLFKGSNDTKSTSEQIVRQRAIMPSELIQMAPLDCIVNVAGPLPPARTQVPIASAPANPQTAIQLAKNFRAMSIITASSRAALAGPAAAAEPEPVIDDTNL